MEIRGTNRDLRPVAREALNADIEATKKEDAASKRGATLPGEGKPKDEIDLRPAVDARPSGRPSIFGPTLTSSQAADRSGASSERGKPSTGEDASARPDPRGRRVSPGDFDRGKAITDLADSWKAVDDANTPPPAGVGRPSGSGATDAMGKNPSNDAGKNRSGSDDTGHGRHYFHPSGGGLDSRIGGGSGDRGSSGSSSSSRGERSNASDDPRERTERQRSERSTDSASGPSAEWWDQMTGGTLHNEQEARAEAERQQMGALADLSAEDQEAYIKDNQEFQRAGIHSEAEAKEMKARQEREIREGKVTQGLGEGSGSTSSGKTGKPAPDASDGTPTPLDRLPKEERKSAVEAEAERKRQVSLPNEGTRVHEAVYMSPEDAHSGFVSRQTDGRSQPVGGDGTTEGRGGGNVSEPNKHRPGPGSLGDPSEVEGGTSGRGSNSPGDPGDD